MRYTDEIISHDKTTNPISDDALKTTELILKDIVRKESIAFNKQMADIDNLIAREVLLQSEQLSLYKAVTGLLTAQKILKDMGNSLAYSVGRGSQWQSYMNNYL